MLSKRQHWGHGSGMAWHGTAAAWHGSGMAWQRHDVTRHGMALAWSSQVAGGSQRGIGGMECIAWSGRSAALHDMAWHGMAWHGTARPRHMDGPRLTERHASSETNSQDVVIVYVVGKIQHAGVLVVNACSDQAKQGCGQRSLPPAVPDAACAYSWPQQHSEP